MIKKIEEPGDLQQLEVGTILIKYPLSGEFAEVIDFTDNMNLLHYQIHNIDQEMQRLGLKMPDKDVPSVGQFIDVNTISGIENIPPVLDKSFDELISDKIWWYE